MWVLLVASGVVLTLVFALIVIGAVMDGSSADDRATEMLRKRRDG